MLKKIYYVITPCKSGKSVRILTQDGERIIHLCLIGESDLARKHLQYIHGLTPKQIRLLNEFKTNYVCDSEA